MTNASLAPLSGYRHTGGKPRRKKAPANRHMHMILRYPDGKRVSALLLSRAPQRLRMAIHGRSDTLELQLIRERWVDDDGHKVSIEAMVPERLAPGGEAAGPFH